MQQILASIVSLVTRVAESEVKRPTFPKFPTSTPDSDFDSWLLVVSIT